MLSHFLGVRIRDFSIIFDDYDVHGEIAVPNECTVSLGDRHIRIGRHVERVLILERWR
jgi:hypothetical protein